MALHRAIIVGSPTQQSATAVSPVTSKETKASSDPRLLEEIGKMRKKISAMGDQLRVQETNINVYARALGIEEKPMRVKKKSKTKKPTASIPLPGTPWNTTQGGEQPSGAAPNSSSELFGIVGGDESFAPGLGDEAAPATRVEDEPKVSDDADTKAKLRAEKEERKRRRKEKRERREKKMLEKKDDLPEGATPNQPKVDGENTKEVPLEKTEEPEKAEKEAETDKSEDNETAPTDAVPTEKEEGDQKETAKKVVEIDPDDL
mmetsp:Transcript_20517/g.44669  ORF Transcript_20517/g.44669 Transcript_20517/m.44669 type:complete len:261 (-) Transcript_20517:1851-2633(-)